MAYNDVRQTTSKKDCNCKVCKNQIKKNTLCFVDPKSKEAWCLKHTKDKSVK
jgi:hypothetical protein